MRLATLKKDLYFGRGGVLPKGTVVQVIEDAVRIHGPHCFVLRASGGLVCSGYGSDLPRLVEFLDDETGHT